MVSAPYLPTAVTSVLTGALALADWMASRSVVWPSTAMVSPRSSTRMEAKRMRRSRRSGSRSGWQLNFDFFFDFALSVDMDNLLVASARQFPTAPHRAVTTGEGTL